MKELVMSLKPLVSSLDQRKKLLGRAVVGVVMTSEPKRPSRILSESPRALDRALWRKALQKVREPIGAPSTRRPSTTSTWVVVPLLSVVLEKFAIALFRSRPSAAVGGDVESIILSTNDEWEVL
eukprot:scaffold7437_cov37-Cyclotella_meneghiniana.AAC.1